MQQPYYHIFCNLTYGGETGINQHSPTRTQVKSIISNLAVKRNKKRQKEKQKEKLKIKENEIPANQHCTKNWTPSILQNLRRLYMFQRNPNENRQC